ncbi:MAG: OOP family OmpA-OmpF porin [Desulforhopalus sp.]|jgi:OOP family OmpA-OmpF porin
MVKGFVSSKSNSPENIRLSEARALSIYKMLLKDGIEAEQIEMEGMGNKEPIASNGTRAGRAKNRRVEITVIGDGL